MQCLFKMILSSLCLSHSLKQQLLIGFERMDQMLSDVWEAVVKKASSDVLKRFLSLLKIRNRVWFICAGNELSSPAKQSGTRKSQSFTVGIILNTLHHNKHAANRDVLSPSSTMKELRTDSQIHRRDARSERHAQSWKTDTAVTHRFRPKQTAGVGPPPQSHIFPVTYKPLTPVASSVTISCNILYREAHIAMTVSRLISKQTRRACERWPRS